MSVCILGSIMKVLTIALLFTSSYLLGQKPLPTNDRGEIEYQKVIETGLSVSDMNSLTLKWAGETYNSLPDVLKLSLEDQIIIKGRFTIPNALSTADITHAITVEFKEGRCRITVNDLYFTPPSGVKSGMNRMNKNAYKGICRKTNERIVSIIRSLEDAMTSPVAKKDDW